MIIDKEYWQFKNLFKDFSGMESLTLFYRFEFFNVEVIIRDTKDDNPYNRTVQSNKYILLKLYKGGNNKPLFVEHLWFDNEYDEILRVYNFLSCVERENKSWNKNSYKYSDSTIIYRLGQYIYGNLSEKKQIKEDA